MSFWDNVKKFAQPYADDDYDDYDEDDDYVDEYDEPAEAPAPPCTAPPAAGIRGHCGGWDEFSKSSVSGL